MVEDVFLGIRLRSVESCLEVFDLGKANDLSTG